jgi:heptosyltransferase-1
VDLQGSWKSAAVALAAGAPARIGFRLPREPGAGVFYTHSVSAPGGHIVEQNLGLMAALRDAARLSSRAPRASAAESGVSQSSSGRSSLLPCEATHEAWAEQELERLGLAPGGFALVNPGAGWGAKCWPAQNYAAVARGLAESGLRSLINFGPGEELLAETLARESGGSAIPFRSTIGELTAMMRRARIFIGGDTGPMHLAAALSIPVVAIFGPTNPARNGPFGTAAVVLRSPSSSTSHARRDQPDAGLLSIIPEMVLAAVSALSTQHSTISSQLPAKGAAS